MDIDKIATLINEDINLHAGILVENADDGMVYADQLEDIEFERDAVLKLIRGISLKFTTDLRIYWDSQYFTDNFVPVLATAYSEILSANCDFADNGLFKSAKNNWLDELYRIMGNSASECLYVLNSNKLYFESMKAAGGEHFNIVSELIRITCGRMMTLLTILWRTLQYYNMSSCSDIQALSNKFSKIYTNWVI